MSISYQELLLLIPTVEISSLLFVSSVTLHIYLTLCVLFCKMGHNCFLKGLNEKTM